METKVWNNSTGRPFYIKCGYTTSDHLLAGRTMKIFPTTLLVELINEAQDRNSIICYDKDTDIDSGEPASLIAVAVGYENIQLLYDAIRPVLEVYGESNKCVQLRSAKFWVSDAADGRASAHLTIRGVPGIFYGCERTGKILSLFFEAWPIQQRKESLIIACVGQRYVDLVREKGYESFQKEKRYKEEKGIMGYKDLPEDFIPKGKG